jgi:hypothetical protein
MAEDKKVYYFVDTREGAKSEKPFGVTNPDAAKKFTMEYNMGEGPFKPVNEEEYQTNRFDLIREGKNTTPNQKEAAAKNAELVDMYENENPYKAMTKDELKEELDARDIEYKTSGPESTNESYQKLLLADDNK